MNVHYVDDDDADLAIMIATARKLPDIELTTSRSLAILFDRLKTSRVDCILLDINRPDTASLEDDIDAIARVSNVPVVLVTGGYANDVRVRATLAGADGVIEKSALSRELLDQVLKNARARIVARSVHGERAPESGVEKRDQLSTPQWFDHINTVLDEIESSLALRACGSDLGLLQEVREAVSRAMREAETTSSISACVPMSWALKAAIDAVAPVAATRDVHVELEPASGTFFPKGPRTLGYLGFRLLLEGLVRTLGPEESIRAGSAPGTDNRCMVSLRLSSHGLTSTDTFFETGPANQAFGTPVNMRLRLAAVLLGMTRQQVSIDATVEEQCLRVAL